MKKLVLLVGLISLIGAGTFAQTSKPALDFTVYDNWKSLSGSQISKDGNYLSYEINPSVGDGFLYIRSQKDQALHSFERGDGALFSPNSDFLVFRIKPYSDSVRLAKLNKVKKEKMPKDSLAVFMSHQKETRKWANLKSFKVPAQGESVIAFVLEQEEDAEGKKTDSLKTESQEKAKTPKAKKKEFNGSELIVYYPFSGKEIKIADVTDYQFGKKGSRMVATSIQEDSLNISSIRILDTQTEQLSILWEQEGITKAVSANEDLSQIAFLHSKDTAKAKVYSLYFWSEKMKSAELLVDTLTEGMPEGFSISENGGLRFSEDGNMLFVGTAKKPENKKEEKDSLLPEERVHIDIWHWQEPVLQSMQLKQLGREKNKTYQALVHLKKKKFVQLGNEKGLESFRMINQGHTERSLAVDEKPYELSNAVNFRSVKDVYLTNLNSGTHELLFKAVEFSPALSPFGNYLYWWEPKDSNYYCYSIDKKSIVNLTKSIATSFAVDNNDYPEETGSYGSMGWTENDRAFYLYDKYDVWKLDPKAQVPALNVTAGLGKKLNMRLRYNRIDREEKFLQEDQAYYFAAFNYKTKKSGYYRMTLNSASPELLVMEDCSYGSLIKAENADCLIWTRGTVKEYPELYVSDLNFDGSQKITLTNPQQSNYNWLDCELVEWMDYDGLMHQGLLYKPEDFDPAKKYPMMVYFYRLHSDELHRHITPKASSSTINAAFYASNGYLVFMPDVYFKIGQPGRSAFNSIVSGVLSLGKEFSYIDMEHVGLQGQSWGGYQTAYIITQTDLFAAASPGAPVSNMTSAYGGIRTSSGMARQVQYEKGQSRIGGTLWEKPVEYYENSPLFYAHQVSTPCLIRHNDNDGAVPFEQGVEFFVALRRLGKPAWLLNYNNGPHNLTEKLSNRKDLSVRMKQFFDHYLKDQPAPSWLEEGVKAIDKKQNETFYLNYTIKD